MKPARKGISNHGKSQNQEDNFSLLRHDLVSVVLINPEHRELGEKDNPKRLDDRIKEWSIFASECVHHARILKMTTEEDPLGETNPTFVKENIKIETKDLKPLESGAEESAAEGTETP